MSLLRTRIREKSRFTVFDIDPITAEQWGQALLDWARPTARADLMTKHAGHAWLDLAFPVRRRPAAARPPAGPGRRQSTRPCPGCATCPAPACTAHLVPQAAGPRACAVRAQPAALSCACRAARRCALRCRAASLDLGRRASCSVGPAACANCGPGTRCTPTWWPSEADDEATFMHQVQDDLAARGRAGPSDLRPPQHLAGDDLQATA
jgi:hypothetical protein